MKSLGRALHVDSIIDHRFELASLDKQGTKWGGSVTLNVKS